MLDFGLSIFLALLAFVGFLFNLYIVISVVMTKQVLFQRKFFPETIQFGGLKYNYKDFGAAKLN